MPAKPRTKTEEPEEKKTEETPSQPAKSPVEPRNVPDARIEVLTRTVDAQRHALQEVLATIAGPTPIPAPHKVIERVRQIVVEALNSPI